MLKHAHVPQPVKRYHYTRKTSPCRTCGEPVPYTTCPNWYCERCRPPSSHPPAYNRTYARRRVAARRIQTEEAAVVVVAAPGFCSVCGCIRLSRANVTGVCDGCEAEKLR
jgi:hypothetical protein